MAHHHIGIDVNRINRIGDRDFVLIAQNIENETAVALRTVGHENLIVRDVDLAIAEIFLRDCRSQEFVPLLGSIAAKRFTVPQLVSGAFDRFDGRLRQRLGHVADSAAYQTLGGFRILLAEFTNPPGDLRKKITGLKLEIIFV